MHHFTSSRSSAILRFLLRRNLFLATSRQQWYSSNLLASSSSLPSSSTSTSIGKGRDLLAAQKHFLLAMEKNSSSAACITINSRTMTTGQQQEGEEDSINSGSSSFVTSSSQMSGTSSDISSASPLAGSDSGNLSDAADDSSLPKIPLNTHALRKVYLNQEEPFLLEANMHRCPFQQFDEWFRNVLALIDLKYEEMNAFALSTVSTGGRPSSRMLLLKGYSSEGFLFFTHSGSRKGRELSNNQRASMLFYWPRVNRQVRIEGRVLALDKTIAEEYWQKRPIATRIGSKLSEQSSVIPGRDYLMEKQQALEELCAVQGELSISRPSDWLGYALQPDYFEFWQGQSNRVHDRIVYELEKLEENGIEGGGGKWHMKRLAP